jgi:PAS domain S-box-containing protein
MHQARNIERELQIHQALLDELLKHSCQAIVLLNTDAEIMFCSQSIKAITGYETEELIGKTAFEFFQPSDIPAAMKQHQYLTGFDKSNFASLIQIRNKEENLIWIDVHVKNLLHVPGMQAIFVLLKMNTDSGVEERKLVQAVIEAKEKEREFLASELHDNVSQVITATKMLVDVARFRSNKDELLHLSSTNLQLIADEIRKLSYSMVSYDLREFGLVFAVNGFINTISKACPINFHINLEEAAVAELSVEQQLHLYRIIQEATNNIIRHAEASMAEIAITKQDGLIYLLIIDNGKGFSINRLKRGMGLSSIANRVKLLQGHFHVRGPQGKGTTIEIHFPIKAIV